MISSPELKRLLVASMTNSTATGVSLTGAEISREIFVSRTLLRAPAVFSSVIPSSSAASVGCGSAASAAGSMPSSITAVSAAAKILRLSITLIPPFETFTESAVKETGNCQSAEERPISLQVYVIIAWQIWNSN